MALVTAKQYGIKADIINRAEEIKKQIQKKNKKISYLLMTNSTIQPPESQSVLSEPVELTESVVKDRYDLERDVIPLIKAYLTKNAKKNAEAAVTDSNHGNRNAKASSHMNSDEGDVVVVVEPGFNPPVSFEGHDCLYVLLLSSTTNQVQSY